MFTEVDWSERGDYIRTRSTRKGASEFDVEPEWATEAVHDPGRVVMATRGSRSGATITVIGMSALAHRLLSVILLAKTCPVEDAWWGVNAWAANARDRQLYEETR